MTEDLAVWLLEQIAEDEASARAATAGPWTVDNPRYVESIRADDGTTVIGGGRWGGEASVFDQDADALHITRWDPTRVLAECDAKREIIKLSAYHLEAWRHQEANPERVQFIDVEARGRHSDRTLKLMALPYVDREGYREEWRP